MCGNAATEAHNSLTKVQFVVESVKRTSNIENGNGNENGNDGGSGRKSIKLEEN